LAGKNMTEQRALSSGELVALAARVPRWLLKEERGRKELSGEVGGVAVNLTREENFPENKDDQREDWQGTNDYALHASYGDTALGCATYSINGERRTWGDQCVEAAFNTALLKHKRYKERFQQEDIEHARRVIRETSIAYVEL
jgi:hypothetical protein